MKKELENAVAGLAYAVAEREANQGCPWLFYQQKQPKKVKELNKLK